MKNEELTKTMSEDDFDTDPALDALCEFLSKNHPGTTTLNIGRYYELLFAKAALDDLLQQNGVHDLFRIEFMPFFCSASLWAEVDDFEVCDKLVFQLAMERADNFEFTPLTNGRLRIAFMFNRMMIPVK